MDQLCTPLETMLETMDGCGAVPCRRETGHNAAFKGGIHAGVKSGDEWIWVKYDSLELNLLCNNSSNLILRQLIDSAFLKLRCSLNVILENLATDTQVMSTNAK